jgi:hypothetical protein
MPVSVIRPQFLQVLTDDIARVGESAACVLALVRYVTALDDEHNGRVLIDGEVWWRASHTDIGDALGGVGHDRVRGVLRRLSAGGALEVRPAADGQSVRMMAYRLPTSKRETAFTSSPEVNAETDRSKRETRRSKRETTSEVNAKPRFPLLTKELSKEGKEGGERAREAPAPLTAPAPTADTLPANHSNGPPPLPYVPSAEEPELGGITPPSRYCDQHQPSGTDGNCRRCGDARTYRTEIWPTTPQGRAYIQFQSTVTTMAQRQGRHDARFAGLAALSGRSIEEQKNRAVNLFKNAPRPGPLGARRPDAIDAEVIDHHGEAR